MIYRSQRGPFAADVKRRAEAGRPLQGQSNVNSAHREPHAKQHAMESC